MSLAIITTTPEGIVLATDSRQSYRNSKGSFRIGSDTAVKIVALNSRVAVVLTGLAFLPQGGVQRNVLSHVDDFKRQCSGIDRKSPKLLASDLHEFFLQSDWYTSEAKEQNNKVKKELDAQGVTDIVLKDSPDFVGIKQFEGTDKDGNKINGRVEIEGLQFGLAGYDDQGGFDVFISHIPGALKHVRTSREEKNAFGASWLGQTDVVERTVLGRDPRYVKLSSIAEALQKQDGDEVIKQFQSLQYIIRWSTMTLQDGIDFAELMIDTTKAIHRFSDGIFMDPGDHAGVGGPTDIAIVTRKDGFLWVKKKKIEYNSEM